MFSLDFMVGGQPSIHPKTSLPDSPENGDGAGRGIREGNENAGEQDDKGRQECGSTTTVLLR